jgi:hypothetical protein
MSSLEKMRLLQDSRRRSLAQIEDKLARLSGRLSEDHPKVVKEKDAKHKQEVKLQRASPFMWPSILSPLGQCCPAVTLCWLCAAPVAAACCCLPRCRARRKHPSGSRSAAARRDSTCAAPSADERDDLVAGCAEAQEEYDAKEGACYKEMEALIEKCSAVQRHVVTFIDHVREMHETVVTVRCLFGVLRSL